MSDSEPSDSTRPARPRFGEYANEKKPARPQFGEYASPEEQRAAIRVPATEDNESVPIESHGDEKKSSEDTARHHVHMPTNRQPKKPSAANNAPIVEARRRTDRFSTFLLLGVGLFSVISTAPSLLQLPQMLTQAYAQFGMGEYTNTSFGTTIGWTILIVYAGLWVAALLLSLRRLAARKRTWWVPFVVGVVANVIYLILLTVAMVNDPAFMQYVNGMNG
ncbi:DUF6264 family protein [Paramicrobacterium fandaimingii]|uniref:DUF6264 family protein n=1 Tax=Paramicrobacterium fandaimingii TaxID=2708079 RepID=UPI0014204E79|nr:DUF6264 family protein [Microbacterium fandaimingii]